MFRTCFTQASRSLASSSRAEMHTSAIRRAKQTVSRAQKKINAKQAKDAARLYAVLGSEYNKTDKWIGCDLQKAILTQEILSSGVAESQVVRFHEGEVDIPAHLSYGIEGGEGKKLLFEVLPSLTAERDTTTFNDDTLENVANAMKEELQKANMFAKVVDLRNANAKGLAFENRRRIIAAFSTAEQPNDTGRPEVQAALLTYQIRNLWAHLLRFRKDVANRRGLRKLVHERAKVLNYLRNADLDRYEAVLPRLGLEPDSVEGELVV